MSLQTKLYSLAAKRRGRAISTTKTIAAAFAGIILLGTLLLMLPASSRSGKSCPFLPTLFTATSATCVTGLTPFDTWSQWSGLGQIVLLCLIEVGGLGFMSVATLVVFLFRRRIGLKQRLVMAQALSLNEINGVVRLQRTVLVGSLSIQGAGSACADPAFSSAARTEPGTPLGRVSCDFRFLQCGRRYFWRLVPGEQSDGISV